MLVGPNNHLPLAVFIFPFIILLTVILIQPPNNRTDIDHFNYTDFDTKNNKEEKESNYELEFDDFMTTNKTIDNSITTTLTTTLTKANTPKLFT